MNSTPKISVIIPMLNSRQYICECLDSVVNQTLKDIEILCIDAGSTDGTREILQEYGSKDSRIKNIDSPKKSYGYQVNIGLDAAKGEYVGIVESDDYILNNMYEIFYGISKKNNLEAVKSDFCEFYGNGKDRTFKKIDISYNRKYYETISNPKKDKRLFYANMLNQPGIYQLSFLRSNNIRLNESPGASYQDNGLWFQIFMYCQKIYFCPKAFYMLRRDNPNSSIKSKEKVYSLCNEYDFIYNIISKNISEKENYTSLCALFRYNNYIWNLERIDDKFKLDFLRRFAADFNIIKNRDEISSDLFTKDQLEDLFQIMENPENYYAINFRNAAIAQIETIDNNNLTQDELLLRLNVLKYLMDAYNSEIEKFHGTLNYKTKSLTRKIRKKIYDGIRCYHRNGILYTLNRILVHLHLRADKNKKLLSSPD